jgi:hypothetical protein
MPVPTNPINDEATSDGERLVRAFLDVFGDDNASRTDSQRIVWAWLEQFSHFTNATSVFTEGRAIDPIQSAQNEGRRMLFISIRDLVEGGFDRTKLEVSR